MSSRPNRAPKLATIGVALILTIIGALGTFGDVLSNTIGVWACVAATLVMLAGILFRKL